MPFVLRMCEITSRNSTWGVSIERVGTFRMGFSIFLYSCDAKLKRETGQIALYCAPPTCCYELLVKSGRKEQGVKVGKRKNQ